MKVVRPNRISHVGLRAGIVFLLLGAVSVQSARPADFYQWTDEDGGLHFSGSLADVPEQYRNAVSDGEFKKEGNLSFSKDRSEKESLPDSSPPATTSQPKQYAIPYRASEGSARRVIIDVTFNDRVTAPVLFDTGAFETIVFADLARQLGLLDHGTPKLVVDIGGIGGSAPAIRDILESMRVGDFRNTFVPITIADPMSDAFQAIIGLDFISNYAVRISPTEKKVVFEEIQSERLLYGGHDQAWWRNYFSEFEAYHSAWLKRRDALKRALNRSQFKIRWQREAVEEALRRSNYYYAASERLLGELNSHANEHAVPMNWRRLRHRSGK
ncbi:MAG: aspartyl protease family protein [Nitrospiria bacterium]